MVKVKNKIIIIILLLLLLGVLLFALDSPYLHVAQKAAQGENISINDIIEESVGVEKGNLSITVTGDVMFGRNMPGVLSLDSSPYRYVDNVTGNTDILLVNTENPFTTSGDAVKPDVPLKASPDYIPLLNGTSGMVISANANNHVFDYGIEGMRDSIENLDSYGIAHIGAGENKAEATKPITIEKEGHKISIFNYMDSENFQEYDQSVMPKATEDGPGYSAWDNEESVEQIRQAKENGSDIIIVYMHYGNEYSRSPNENQKEISHLAIDAGASAVVGSHAHVTQGIEMYNGKPIFYNLGNFMFDQSNPNTHTAYFVEFDVKNENVTANIYPVYISGYLPQFMGSSDGESLLSSLDPQCDEMVITPEGTGKINFSIRNSTQ